MTDVHTAQTIAFIGLGKMGLPMSGRLVEAGFRVQGFDVSEAGRAAFAEAGGSAATSVADALESADTVILMLPNSAIVESVVSSAEFIDASPAGLLVVDMSSSDPVKTKELAARAAERGLRMIDAPVSGGVSGARAGTLTIMAGGSSGDLERALPILAALGKTTHAGSVGSGHAIKALNNLLSATHLWVTSEAMLIGERFGLDPSVMLAIFNSSSGRSGSTENKWPNFILPETYNSGFGLQLMLKDMRVAVELAQQIGIPSRLGEDSVAFWAEASDNLAADADHTEIARWLRQRADAAAAADTALTLVDTEGANK